MEDRFTRLVGNRCPVGSDQWAYREWRSRRILVFDRVDDDGADCDARAIREVMSPGRRISTMGMMEEDNKKLAHEFLAALSRADTEWVAAHYDDDMQLWTAGSLPFSGSSNREEALAGMPQILGLFPEGIEFEIHALTAEGERVAIEATSRGTTFRGDVYAQQYHFLMRARDGKIFEFREYMDTDLARKVLVGE
jgi:uncharacterized protein